MNRDSESHVFPALVAAVGIVAFTILVYLILLGADWLINHILSSGGGIPI